jgi:PTS system fructose-specific IIA component
MKISDILSPGHVLFNVRVSTKTDLIDRVLLSFKDELSSDVHSAIREAVFEREKLMSTGVGKNVAIPHAKVAGLTDNLLALAILAEPVDYDSIDGSPVDLLMMLVGPQDNRNHIKLLSRISKLMNKDSFRRAVKECNTATEVIACFRREEESGMEG